GGSKIYGGFGISNGAQSAALADSVDAVVAGSVFVRIITQTKDNKAKLFEEIKAKTAEITGA
ncbi:MAG: tryptophan synthase subunit alpha, partial [Spirochaetaceae bacterium]|nr:tryptophan synthase subunit alpha [Spirochaetaceae bacterium]